MSQSKILFIGDIIGALGRKAVNELLPELKASYNFDFVIANGENSAHGYGITYKVYAELLRMGVDAVTMGNHVWDKKELLKEIKNYDRLVRPGNFPQGAPGKEILIIEKNGTKIGIINLLGRVFMTPMECPFKTADRLIEEIKKDTNIIIVDMHAEASSEKVALGNYLDGRVSLVLGTHTHVLTADERILSQGTAYITDVGMVGAYDSIIGMKKESIIKRFVTGLPEKFEPTEEGSVLFNAIYVEIDNSTGKATKIEAIKRIVNPL